MGSNSLSMRCEVDRGLGKNGRKLGEERKGCRGGRGCSRLSWDREGLIYWVDGRRSWGHRGMVGDGSGGWYGCGRGRVMAW